MKSIWSPSALDAVFLPCRKATADSSEKCILRKKMLLLIIVGWHAIVWKGKVSWFEPR